MSEFTLVLNAGGGSKRMGGLQKALLPVPPCDQPLVVYIVELLAPLATAGIVVVANDVAVAEVVAARPGTPTCVVRDLWPGAGAMGGIATGLTYCADWAIVTACDMPFVNPALFGMFCRLAGENDDQGRRRWDAIVPRIHGYPQMLHTLYHVDMLPVFRRCIEEGDLKLLNVLREAHIRYVSVREIKTLDPDLRSFTNVNTPAEWDEALRDLKKPPNYSR